MKRILLLSCLILISVPGRLAAATDTPEKVDVHSYRMKGKVRLLFFWVGKDDVGGGTITLRRSGPGPDANWSEEVEVLFGSNPDRVPGQINRWGYGRETAIWAENPASASSRDLQSTVFEGFMKHSKEESLDEVQKNNEQQQGTEQFLYDGIRSMAGAGSAAAEIRTFSTPTDFRYQDSAPVHCGYQERLKLGEPDRVRKLDPRPSSFTSPYGFLTGVHDLIRRVLQNSSDPNRVRKTSASLNYAYNGRTYLLELKSTDYLKKFDLELAAGQLKDNKPFVSFDDVAKADFRITNLTTSEKHDFTLWFPLTGQLRGVPLRIVDKPRWWLRIELNLDPDAKTAPPRANLDCSISAQ